MHRDVKPHNVSRKLCLHIKVMHRHIGITVILATVWRGFEAYFTSACICCISPQTHFLPLGTVDIQLPDGKLSLA